MKNTAVAVDHLEHTMDELFSTHRFTGERQQILAGLFKWLRDNEYARMSPGEVKSAIRDGFPEILEKYDDQDPEDD